MRMEPENYKNTSLLSDEATMFEDRADAANRLAEQLRKYRSKQAVVLALPRGGVVLGDTIARSIGAALDIVLVKKISHPDSSEYAIGAIVEREEPIWNIAEVDRLDEQWRKQAIESARELITKRRKLYFRGKHQSETLQDRIVIIVDDGIATGFTMRAAAHYVHKNRPKKIIIAVPVASSSAIKALKSIADEIIVLNHPSSFFGYVGAHYKNFDQVSDKEVMQHLLGS